jgi:taurine transport system permease protein
MTADVLTSVPRTSTIARRIGRRLLRNTLVRNVGPFIPIIALWWAVAAAGVFPSAFFVGPDAVLVRIGALLERGILTGYLVDSLYRLGLGVVFGLAAGGALGLLVGLSRIARRLTWPLLVFFQAIGDIAWLPLLIVWFGFSLTSVTMVIVYTVVFPLALSITAGIASVPEDMRRAAASLGAGRFRTLFEVILPGALPGVVSGIRTGLGYGWRALIAAEIIVGTSGIGFMMFDARRVGQVTDVFVGMIVLGVLWYALDALVLAPLERETVERWGMVRRAAGVAR